MKGQEVIQALVDGKKVRIVTWDNENYIYLLDNKLYWDTGAECSYPIFRLFDREWELYKQPTFLFKDVPDGHFFKYKGCLGVKKKLEDHANGFYKFQGKWLLGLFCNSDVVEYPASSDL